MDERRAGSRLTTGAGRRPRRAQTALPRPSRAFRADRRSTSGTKSRRRCPATLRLWWQGVRAGELGSLPIIVGLVVIVIVFGILDDTFLTPRNFTNLLLQMAAVATIAIGVVFVLLIGEIDLSVAFVSAVGGVVMTLLLRPDDPGWPWWAAIGVAPSRARRPSGSLQALVITKAGVPSFVVTLAGLLIWSGVVLILTTQYSTAGTIRIQDDTVVGIANDFLSDVLGMGVGGRGRGRATRSPAADSARTPRGGPVGEADAS